MYYRNPKIEFLNSKQMQNTNELRCLVIPLSLRARAERGRGNLTATYPPRLLRLRLEMTFLVESLVFRTWEI